PTPVSTPTPAGKFAIGSTVGATFDVNVRQTASGTLLGVQAAGAVGTVTGGPQTAVFNGAQVIWWNIKFPSSPSGWVGQDNLVVVTPTPTPTAPPTPTATPTPTPQATYNAWK